MHPCAPADRKPDVSGYPRNVYGIPAVAHWQEQAIRRNLHERALRIVKAAGELDVDELANRLDLGRFHTRILVRDLTRAGELEVCP